LIGPSFAPSLADSGGASQGLRIKNFGFVIFDFAPRLRDASPHGRDALTRALAWIGPSFAPSLADSEGASQGLRIKNFGFVIFDFGLGGREERE
jgi:hypothetical protein